jgi:hypothetical protein
MNLKHILLSTALALAAVPLLAQAPAAPPNPNAIPDSRRPPIPPPPDPPPPNLSQTTPVPTPAKPPQQVFGFNGGSFYEFVKDLTKAYGTNALELFQYPEERLTFNIPKMRVPGEVGDLRSVLFVYNKTSEAGDWYLGKWVYLPESKYGYAAGVDTSLRTLSFLPPKLVTPGGGSGIAVKAFSIGNLSTAEQKGLEEIVNQESRRLQEYIAEGRYGRQDPAEATGRISLHESTGLLVATGGKTYVELVASVVQALEKRQNMKVLRGER